MAKKRLDGWLTAKQIAEAYGYNVNYIWQLASEKGELIGAQKFGHAWMIEEKTFVEYVNNNRSRRTA